MQVMELLKDELSNLKAAIEKEKGKGKGKGKKGSAKKKGKKDKKVCLHATSS